MGWDPAVVCRAGAEAPSCAFSWPRSAVGKKRRHTRIKNPKRYLEFMAVSSREKKVSRLTFAPTQLVSQYFKVGFARRAHQGHATTGFCDRQAIFWAELESNLTVERNVNRLFRRRKIQIDPRRIGNH